jgi:hypothetical protein
MITKIDAAERQLNTSIKLFFENRDRLSSYTLAIASREVTDDIIESKSDEIFQTELARLGDPDKVRLSFRELFKDLIKPEHYKEALVLSRNVQNFLKHANRDPDAEIEELSKRDLALNIMFAIWNFSLLVGRMSREMGIFHAWFAVAEPKVVKLSSDPFSVAILAARQSPLDPYDDAIFEAACRSLNKLENGIFGQK